ncbi:hypothetical protein KSP39_PZI009705 [Platanthera zijinensis]|uniref:Uncharacterized protein n=1 Tax=Platanthera zijinensis TaxID=2320716 RepID=A0AAP0BIR8_9ASPA
MYHNKYITRQRTQILTMSIIHTQTNKSKSSLSSSHPSVVAVASSGSFIFLVYCGQFLFNVTTHLLYNDTICHIIHLSLVEVLQFTITYQRYSFSIHPIKSNHHKKSFQAMFQ